MRLITKQGDQATWPSVRRATWLGGSPNWACYWKQLKIPIEKKQLGCIHELEHSGYELNEGRAQRGKENTRIRPLRVFADPDELEHEFLNLCSFMGLENKAYPLPNTGSLRTDTPPHSQDTRDHTLSVRVDQRYRACPVHFARPWPFPGELCVLNVGDKRG